MINKILAASITVAFLVAVKPDPAPSAFGFAITSVLMYEGLNYCIGYIQQVHKKKRDKRYITLTKRDMRRWADEWITPAIREVR